jgi:cation transport ATPase
MEVAMTRKTTTVMLESAECAAGSVHTVETVLLEVPGVSRAYVNPVTEAAYVEYDADRCSEADLERAIESIGVRSLRRASVQRFARRPVPATPNERRLPMTDSAPRSRTWWAFAGFIVIAGFFLLTEHRAHFWGILPFVFLLACLLLHMFGHGGHGGKDANVQPNDDGHRDYTAAIGGAEESRGRHQRSTGATRDDWRN